MASRTFARTTDRGPAVPAMGTLPSSANTLYPKDTIVTRSAAGRAVSPSTADASGYPAMGISKATFDNRTNSEMGGLDDSGEIEVDYGVFGFDISGDTPKPGDDLFVVDNQTVSTDSAGGTRGFAGVCSEVRTGSAGTSQAFVWMGPHVAHEGAELGGRLVSPISLAAFRLSTGAAIPAFAAGSADGFELTNSEALGLRINDDSTTIFTTTVTLVDNDGGDLVLHLQGFRVGAADPTATITVGAFFHVAGEAHTADANAGGSSTAFDGATTIITEETLTIAAADVPAGPCTLTITLVASAALDDDALVLLGLWLEGAKAA